MSNVNKCDLLLFSRFVHCSKVKAQVFFTTPIWASLSITRFIEIRSEKDKIVWIRRTP